VALAEALVQGQVQRQEPVEAQRAEAHLEDKGAEREPRHRAGAAKGARQTDQHGMPSP
jgi:hypothetical protein